MSETAKNALKRARDLSREFSDNILGSFFVNKMVENSKFEERILIITDVCAILYAEKDDVINDGIFYYDDIIGFSSDEDHIEMKFRPNKIINFESNKINDINIILKEQIKNHTPEDLQILLGFEDDKISKSNFNEIEDSWTQYSYDDKGSYSYSYSDDNKIYRKRTNFLNEYSIKRSKSL